MMHICIYLSLKHVKPQHLKHIKPRPQNRSDPTRRPKKEPRSLEEGTKLKTKVAVKGGNSFSSPVLPGEKILVIPWKENTPRLASA